MIEHRRDQDSAEEATHAEQQLAKFLEGINREQRRRPTARSATSAGAEGRREQSPVTFESLEVGLSSQVLDQPAAIAAVSRALVAPLNGLKLRPHRPNGVFLFNGTTGVGKTSLASALATTVYGSSERLITIDCSDLHNSAAVNRLTGPPPGYVGYDDASSWLSTRVENSPRSVVLFDEVEKAGPELWNLLLQICDAGRLTDARGTTADFSDTIVVLTGNIGAADSMRSGVGFSAGVASITRTNVLEQAVDRVLPPELVARLDDVITFEPLGRSSLRRIARARADEFADNVRPNGWEIEIDDDVVDHVTASCDRAERGARQVDRALERLVLAGLAGRRPGQYRAHMYGDDVVWIEREV